VPTVLARRFRLLDPLGAGASGTVWRAWDRRARRVAAVKLLPSYGVPPTPEVGHPHLLVPYARVPDGESVVHALHLVRGGTAGLLLAEHGALPEDFVAVLVAHLLGALAALHGVGLVHRDVTPANLLLEPTGAGRPHLWLSDLDLVAPAGSPAPVGTGPLGTPGYVAPEVVTGSATDPRQDLFAAGVIAGELLTGHVPRRARDLPRGRLRTLLAALVDDDPGRRPSDAGAALAMLHETGVPPGAPWRTRSRPPVVPDRWRRRLSRGCGC
jgi:serine/threonine-protein kinase